MEQDQRSDCAASGAPGDRQEDHQDVSAPAHQADSGATCGRGEAGAKPPSRWRRC